MCQAGRPCGGYRDRQRHLSFLACNAGAGHVTATETSGIIEKAKAAAAQNGFLDRMTFVHGHSRDIRLRKRADVIITETMGSGGLNENIAGILLDARRRFLKKDGKLIPRSMDLMAAPVFVPNAQRRQDFWNKKQYGFDFRAFLDFSSNRVHSVRVYKGRLTAKPARLFHLDFYRRRREIFSAKKIYSFRRTCCVNGFLLWFKTCLVPGVHLSNAPGKRGICSWDQLFFPAGRIFRIKRGQSMGFKLKAISLKKRFIWEWQVIIFKEDRMSPMKTYRFLNFNGIPFSRDSLK